MNALWVEESLTHAVVQLPIS